MFFSLRGCAEFSPNPCPHTPQPLITSIPYQTERSATASESTLTRQCPPNTVVYIRVHSWCCAFYEAGQMYNDITIILVLYRTFSLCYRKKGPLSSMYSFLSPTTPCWQLWILPLSPQFRLLRCHTDRNTYTTWLYQMGFLHLVIAFKFPPIGFLTSQLVSF